MFERFTERARKVVVLAQDEARRLGHDYIGTEHLLLGLLREDEGVAARVLSNLDVVSDRLRGGVLRRLDADLEPDPLDEGEGRRMLFRGRVGGIQVGTASAGTLVVDLDYAYEVSEGPEGALVAVNHDGLVDLIGRSLEAADAGLPEQVAREAGELLLRGVPEISEVTVVVSRPQVSGLGSVSGFSVSGTFRR